MANHLGMALIDTIVTLHQRGWSARRIARELGIHRETVARYLAASSLQAKPAIAPSGNSPDDPQAKPAIAPSGNPLCDPGDAAGEIAVVSVPSSPSLQTGKPGRRSDCLPFVAVIDTKLQQGLSAQRIYQDLVADHGFVGSYYSVRRYVQNAQSSTAVPSGEWSVPPGRSPGGFRSGCSRR